MYVIIACKSNSFIGFSVFFHYLFLHLPSHSKRNSDVDMQALLNDIELDIQELTFDTAMSSKATFRSIA